MFSLKNHTLITVIVGISILISGFVYINSSSATSIYLPYATRLSTAGVINTNTESGYRLADNLSRAELAKIAGKIGSLNPTTCTGLYQDVGSSLGDLCGYIEALRIHGSIQSASLFRPTDTVSRAEAVKMLLGVIGEEGSYTASPYYDTANLGDLTGYINRAYAIGCIKKSTYFYPKNAILRGEVFEIGACLIDKGSTPTTPTNTVSNTDPLGVYKKMYGATSVTSDGTYVTLVSDGIPKSKSVYYALTHPLYELFSGKTFGGYTFKKNPNTIAEGGVFTMKIPLNPKVATTHQKTSLGAIGMAIDGVPFFNQYAGPNKPLTDEMQSFDQNDGHPERSGHYHYHVEPLAITKEKGTDALMGFLLDGFPVYGTYENGKKITNADLDNYHGHSHVTLDYPNGIYHYHITDEVPYLNGDGYYGTPGTLSQK